MTQKLYQKVLLLFCTYWILKSVMSFDSDEDYEEFGMRTEIPRITQTLQPSDNLEANQCGGYILVNATTHYSLIYTNPEDPNQLVTCVWIIRVLQTPMAIVLMDHNFDGPNGTTANLSLQNGFNTEETTSVPILPEDKEERMIIQHHHATTLVFTSRGGQHFHLMFLDGYMPHNYSHSYNVKMIRRESDELTEFKYPSNEGSELYSSNEVLQVVFQSSPGKMIRLSVDKIDLEASYDHLFIYKYVQTTNKFILLRSLTGQLLNLDGVVFEANENEPMILRFVTDGSTQLTGFKVTYSYETPTTIKVDDLSIDLNTNQSVATSNPCGGFLILANVTELIYTNPSDDDQELVCVWTLWAISGGPIGFTLVDQNFTSSNGSSGILTLQNGFGSTDASSVPRWITPGMQGRPLTQDYMASVLVFVSKGGQGFRLLLRSMGLTKNHNSTAYGETIRQKSNSTEMYSYPSIAGKQYSSSQWRFIVLESSKGKTIHLNVDYVDTEHRHDYLKIFKFSKPNNNFQFMRKLTGHMGFLDDESFTGDEDMPILLYFHTDGSVEGLGFKISYSYQNTVKNIPNIPTAIISDSCGGTVEPPATLKIGYRNNASSDIERTCVWIIWAAPVAGRITLLLEQFNFTSTPPQLSIHSSDLTNLNNSVSRRLDSEDIGTDIFYRGISVAIVFTSRPNQSFVLNVQNLGIKERLLMNPQAQSFQRLNDYPVRFSYPPSLGSRYLDNERLYVVLQGYPNKEISLSIDFIDTEAELDSLFILKFNKQIHRFQLLRSLSGRLGVLRVPIQFYSDEGQPLVLAFHSDHSAEFYGFRLSYSYQSPGQRSTTVSTFYPVPTYRSYIWTTMQTTTRRPVTFRLCGGLVILPDVTDLTYESPPGTDEKICIFTIWASNGGPIGLRVMELPGQNEGKISVGSLSLQTGFTSVDGPTTVELLDDVPSSELLHNFAVTTLVFVAEPEQKFHIKLRGLGQSQAHTQWNNGFISLTMSRKPDESISFSYPREDGTQYRNYQSQTVVIEAFPKRRIQLFHGPIGEIETAFFNSNENEPMLLYFFSDHSETGQGFKITYSYKLSEMSSRTNSSSPREEKVGNKGQQSSRQSNDVIVDHNIEGHETSKTVYLLLVAGILVVTFGVIYTVFYAKKSLCMATSNQTPRTFFPITWNRDFGLRQYNHPPQQQNSTDNQLLI